jgi:hypothetical protein
MLFEQLFNAMALFGCEQASKETCGLIGPPTSKLAAQQKYQ